MPDLDRVERVLHPAWRVPYNLIKGGQPAEEIYRAILKALARLIREEGGLEGLANFVRAMQRHEAGQLDRRGFYEVVALLDHQMQTIDGKLLARAAHRPRIAGAILQGPPAERLVRQFLMLKIEHGLFSQQRDYLVGKCFASRREALRFETETLGGLRRELGDLARSLSSGIDAKRVKAPRLRGIKKKSTRELLDERL